MYGFDPCTDSELLQRNQVQYSDDDAHHTSKLTQRLKTATKLPMRSVAAADHPAYSGALSTAQQPKSPMLMQVLDHQSTRQMSSALPRTTMNLSSQPAKLVPCCVTDSAMFPQTHLVDWSQFLPNYLMNDHVQHEKVPEYIQHGIGTSSFPTPGDLTAYSAVQSTPHYDLLYNADRSFPSHPDSDLFMLHQQGPYAVSPNSDEEHHITEYKDYHGHQIDIDYSTYERRESANTTRSMTHQPRGEEIEAENSNAKKQPANKAASNIRRRQTHSIVERKYRENLNSKIAELHNLIQATRNQSQLHREDLHGAGGHFVTTTPTFIGMNPGPAVSRNHRIISESTISTPTNVSNSQDIRKADVLNEAIDYIKETQIKINYLIEEINQLKRQYPMVQGVYQ